ncbi:multidrug efflux pump subunit AcrA (membrane-fusion protein) [Murinocardiopsis flavida]|uniref:Multidrug efflux pump subunit AcrA (Membrane-fusion protein) n=1 Tax=Murinocardiopsis flavida TaxID=645275 RepID=A0A2P8DDY7_9ACTN|nr:peptidoglycan-binding protein [Murinocardiopsis flavida]PSK95399.1 multidrug efflux pump subunit AcrA (membrane-fusion protein) [Murinocardiopsis flavida]
MGEATVEDRADPVPADEERTPRRPRRRGRVLAVVAVAVVASAAAAAGLGLRGGSDSGGAAAALPPETAEVESGTLRDSESFDGELAFGTAATATSRRSGTLTWLPESGATVGRGETLFEVDADPVTLMYGGKPAYRDLVPGTSGTDVRQLEENLAKLGYDGFTADDEYTGGTAAAVLEWQGDRKLDETGTVDLGSVVFAAGSVRVDGLQAGEGDDARPGGKILDYTATDKAVTVQLETADQRLADKGGEVDVTLPDGDTVKGEIDEVDTVIEEGGDGEEPKTMIEVVVRLTGEKAQQAAEDYALASVEVAFTAETREDVLTVPVAALLALEQGGFGVEVVAGGSTSYVPVETGLFADGRVEVSGDGIAEGTTVGMPK